MNYHGIIIEESLRDTDVLKDLKILSTRVEPVTSRHKTPWLKQWTLHSIEVSQDSADAIAEKLSGVLETQHWYIDYGNDTTHYLVFPGKVFKVDRSKPEQYKPAVSYGLSLGIPDYQLDFSPTIQQWQRPE